MDKIILVTQEELKALIYEVLENYYKDKKLEKEQEYSNSLTIDAAVDFLTHIGFPTSKTQLYRLTSNKKIPHGNYGNRLVFRKNELLIWAEKNTTRYDQ